MLALRDDDLVVIDDSDNAYVFSDDLSEENAEKSNNDEQSETFTANVMRTLKSFLPRVEKVRPVRSVLMTGRELNMLAPQRVH